MNSKFDERKSDMWRIYGNCGHCKKDTFFVKRIIVKQGGVEIISPSHFCKQCRGIISNQLNK